MDCTDCGPRKDRPHLFLAHQPSTCPTCRADREGRVVARDGQIFCLVHCPECGAGEHLTAAVEAFRAARMVNQDSGIVGRVLRLLGALALADETGVLAQARAAVAGE